MINRSNKCFVYLAIKALKIKKNFKLYTSEKEYAKAENESAEVNKCLCTDFSESFNSVLNAPKNVKNSNFLKKFHVEDSIENFILKSVFGFLGGTLLTYICFMFLVFSLNFTLKRATNICMGLGVILSLGLAFSVKIRCVVFLCIPQLFSKRGRQALLAYAFILALSGPAKNTLHNVEVMSESLACTQEQLKQAENELTKCVQKPNTAARKSVEKLLEKLIFAVKDFKNFILQLYKNCFDILETVLHARKWLYSITLLCHKKMDKPAHRCLNLLAEARENCETMVPCSSLKQYCRITPEGQERICSTDIKSLCMRTDVPECLPVLRLQKQLDSFKHRVWNIFCVSMEAHQTYFQTNRSFTCHEEYQGMATEIRQKTDQFLQYFDFMSVIFGIFILVLFVKVIIYRHKFLTEDQYDNRYITSDFVDIDNTRAAFRMKTLLPLAPREKLRYIKVSSVRLVPCEKIRLLSSFVFLILATFKIIVHILTDSSLYWILSSVRRDERMLYMSTLEDEEPIIAVRVIGDGLVAGLFRNVTSAVKRQSTLNRLDPTPCLPDPIPPDWNRYYQIIALVIICWLLALCEPYGLRLRHTVMVTYHPDRARERAIWLYNKIISNRINFVKISRRQLRRKFKNTTFGDTFRYKFMRKTSTLKCLLCKTSIFSTDSHVKCSTEKCLGLYCSGCFANLKVCSICTDPTEYGDLSDLSEEKDSSEEENVLKNLKNIEGKGNPSRYKEKQKEGLLLNIKKTKIKLKEGKKESKSETSCYDGLIQPTFLLRVLEYCRSKIPAFTQLKSMSDVESSDWDHDYTLISGDAFAKDKTSDVKSEDKKSSCCTERKSKKKNKIIIKLDPISENNLEKTKKIDLQVQKVCLFKKVPSSNSEQSLKPITIKKFGIQQPHMSLKKSTKDSDNFTVGSQTTNVFSFPVKAGSREKNSSTVSQTLDSETVVNEETEKEEVKQIIYYPSHYPDSLNSQIVVDTRYFEPSPRSQTYPFIDPDNVHEFYPGEIPTEEDSSGRKEKTDEKYAKIEKVDISSLEIKSAQVQSTSESTADSDKICVKQGLAISSSECDCQFYNQPCDSVRLEPSKINSDVKKGSRKKDQINFTVNTSNIGSLFSVETDSSNEKFLSVKPFRKMIIQLFQLLVIEFVYIRIQ